MAAIWFRFRAELRTRWRGALALALLVGLAGGIVLTTVAGARRTDSAYSELITETDAPDLLVNPNDGNGSELVDRYDEVARLPQVERLGVAFGVFVLPVGVPVEEIFDDIQLAPTEDDLYDTFGFNVLDGRLPNPRRVDEVAVDFRVAEREDLRPGDSFRGIPIDTEALIARLGTDDEDALLAAVERGDAGEPIEFTVTGVVATPDNLVVDEGFETGSTYFTAALLDEHPGALIGFHAAQVKLERGAARRAGLPAGGRGARAGRDDRVPEPGPHRRDGRACRAAVHRRALDLRRRRGPHHSPRARPGDHPPAVPRRRRRSRARHRRVLARAAARARRAAHRGVRSPGRAVRRAAGDPGLAADADRAGRARRGAPRDRRRPGGARPRRARRCSSVVGLLALVAARRLVLGTDRERAPGPPSRALVARVPFGPSATNGIRFAVEPGRGRTAVPVRTTLVAATVAVLTVVAALTFAAGLDRLLETPRLFGVTWQLEVDGGGETHAEVEG